LCPHSVRNRCLAAQRTLAKVSGNSM